MRSMSRNLALVVLVVVVVGLVGALAAGCGSTTTTTAAPGTTQAASTTTMAPASTTNGATTTTAAGATTTQFTTTTVAGKVNLNGAGATFPQPVYLEWIGQYTQTVVKDVSLNYQGIGSGGGIQQFTQGSVDFGASDAPMKDTEIATAEAAGGAKVLHIPTVFGSITLSYNLAGVSKLNLDPDTIAGIFLGTITKWNDPKLVAINTGITLPAQDIKAVYRSDSSGTTNAFTSYLAEVNADWKAKVGAGKTVKWPVGVGGQGNDGVAAVVKQSAGAIGYVELAYALNSSLPVAAVKNQSGKYITPSLASTTAAATGAKFPADLRFSVSNSANPDAYPIVTATWILAWDKMKDPAKASALKAWLTWALNDGKSIANDLGYATLPADLQAAALAKVNLIN